MPSSHSASKVSVIPPSQRNSLQVGNGSRIGDIVDIKKVSGEVYTATPAHEAIKRRYIAEEQQQQQQRQQAAKAAAPSG
jgi:hypothetical protein